MTVPVLIQKHQEQVTVNKLKKFYSVISQAYLNVINEYGPIDQWGLSDTQEEASTQLYERFKPYLKIVKDCGYEEGCYVNDNLTLANGNNIVNFITDKNKRYMFMLADGSAVALFAPNILGKQDVIYYDVNGIKPPNKFGTDIFQLQINNYKVYPMEFSDSGNDLGKSSLEGCMGSGFNCAFWILTYGNMDYLHCFDYMKENNATKCD